MEKLPAAPSPRTCRTCGYWTPGWVGPQTWGFCTWRESLNRSRQPRMNHASHYSVSADGHVLETRHDAGCIQWVQGSTTTADKPKAE